MPPLINAVWIDKGRTISSRLAGWAIQLVFHSNKQEWKWRKCSTNSCSVKLACGSLTNYVMASSRLRKSQTQPVSLQLNSIWRKTRVIAYGDGIVDDFGNDIELDIFQNRRGKHTHTHTQRTRWIRRIPFSPIISFSRVHSFRVQLSLPSSTSSIMPTLFNCSFILYIVHFVDVYLQCTVNEN